MKKTNPRCKGCGSHLVFVPEKGKLVCPHCRGEVDIPHPGKQAFFKVAVFKDEEDKELTKQLEQEAQPIQCPMCGGTQTPKRENGIIATQCEYCEATLPDLLEKGLIGEEDASIVPFAISQEKAGEVYRTWVKESKFTAKALKTAEHDREKLKSNYFPSYVYNFDTTAQYSGVGIRFHRKQVAYKDSNGVTRYRTEVYKTTHPFNGNEPFKYYNYFDNAGSVVNDLEFKRLDYDSLNSDLKYTEEYMYGFTATSKNITFPYSLNKAKKRIENDIEYKIKRSLGYDDYQSFSLKTNYTNQEVKKCYLPVWSSQFYFKNKTYGFKINGANGKITGKLPRSAIKIFFAVLGIVVGIVAIAAGLYMGGFFN